jgi:hypothetical protein
MKKRDVVFLTAIIAWLLATPFVLAFFAIFGKGK